MITFLNPLRRLHSSRYLLKQLALRELTSQYKKSFLGMFWAFAEPLAFMFILYIVFGIGLRSGQDMEVPFICYMSLGMAVVNSFNGSILKGTGAINRHKYLLNKVNVNLAILPLANVISGFIDHMLFMLAVVVILIVNGVYPSLNWVFFIYYSISLYALVTGIVFFTSSIAVIAPDVYSIISILTRLLFYATPVFWDFSILPNNLQFILSLNPLVYIAEGYRTSFYGVSTSLGPVESFLYYWILVFILGIVGNYTFKKLRPVFADYM